MTIQILKTLIAQFFKDEWYSIGIKNLRQAIKEDPIYKNNWESIIKLVLLKQIPDGEAMNIMFNDGNQILHKNTEEEAYNWMLLMIINVSRNENDVILDYQKYLDRNLDNL